MYFDRCQQNGVQKWTPLDLLNLILTIFGGWKIFGIFQRLSNAIIVP